MTTPLPAATDYTSAANQAAKKTFMTSVRTFLADLLGTAGHGFDGALLAAPRRVTFVGTADAITSTLAPAPAAYVTGMCITGLLPGANTITGPTINLNSLGVRTAKKRSGTGAKVALVIGDYNGVLPFEFEYDGTDFILLNPLVPARVDIASAATLDLSATSGNLRITGTTAVTAVTLASGQMRRATADAALPLTNGASLVIQGAQSYTCTAGDSLTFIGEPAGVVRVIVDKADGTPVVGSAVPYTAIAGFTLSSIAGTNTTASLTVAAGQATALQGSATTQTTQITKATTTAWAASNGNAINGTDAAASTLANSATYHVYMCSGASGTGSFVSASLAPAFPAGYAVSARRVGSFNTTGAGAPIPYTSVETAGGSIRNYLTTQTLDVSATASASRVLYTLNVPTGIKVRPLVRWNGGNAAYYSILWTSGDETDVAPAAIPTNSWSAAPGGDGGSVGSEVTPHANQLDLTTNTSGQIGARGTTAVPTIYLVTRGWDDFRRA